MEIQRVESEGLDPIELERRAREHRHPYLEVACVLIADVGAWAITAPHWVWQAQLGLVVALSLFVVIGAQKAQHWYAKWHSVPLEMYGDQVRKAQGAVAESQAEVANLIESRPRIRKDLVISGPKTAMYSKTGTYAVRVHNDGAAARFRATVRITDDFSPSMIHVPGDHPIEWNVTIGTTAEIMTGAYDDLFFGTIEIFPKLQGQPPRVRIFALLVAEGKTFDVWESLRLLQGGTVEPFVVVEVTIYSDPSPIGGPERLYLRLGPTELTDISPSASHIVRRPFRESSS